MIYFLRAISPKVLSITAQRGFSVTAARSKDYSCKLLILGGGSGGCTIAARFAKKLPKDSVCVVEPSCDHFYQPLWTLVGAGVKTLADTRKPEKQVLPKDICWVQQSATSIDPDSKSVCTDGGDRIFYEYLVIAVGIKNDYHKIPGLQESLDDPCSMVSTIYSSRYCEKTWRDLQRFQGGMAVFTMPPTPVKCPGAPQKIVYLADSYFNKRNIRKNTRIVYASALGVIFGVKKYADALTQVVAKKDITVCFHQVLKEIRRETTEVVLVSNQPGCEGTETIVKYDFLHVTPHMSPPDVVCKNEKLADPTGFLNVNKFTLQHVKYPNIFGIGDCTTTPNSKTAAAVSKQSHILEQNLMQVMSGICGTAVYNGYGACPLVTSYSTCILAEFLYDGVVHETFPFNQAKESRWAYEMKKGLFPYIYWNYMLKGRYNGPEFVRKIVNPFAK